ncbi:MAG: tRNA (adenosine(37)-N6)-threonylcarbamoyltransferase complex ATPase subunit type 1 TsaE [Actinomycetota bacterium]
MSGGLAVVSRSSEETRILGASLAPLLLPGDVLSLNGDLGAGKTCFVQGLASALGVAQRVTSPTFTLVHEYSGRFPVVHLDVYRLNFFQEVLDLGFEELLDPGAILVVEWGEAVSPLLPNRFLEIELRRVEAEENHRSVSFLPRGPGWELKLETMRVTAEALLDAASADDSTGERFQSVSDQRARHRRLDGPHDSSDRDG